MRCMLKPGVDFDGAFVAEVWAYDPDSRQYEVEGILATIPEAAATPASWLSENSVVLDLAGRGSTVH